MFSEGMSSSKTTSTRWRTSLKNSLTSVCLSISEDGFIVVLEEGPQMKILARNDMGEPCVATPAIADGRLYIRTREKVFCVSDK